MRCTAEIAARRIACAYVPQVYACENLRAAQALLDARWPTLRVFLMPAPEMVRAMAPTNLKSRRSPNPNPNPDP